MKMTQGRFDELVKYVKREHIVHLDYYEGESGDGYAELYWLTVEEHPERAEAEIESLIGYSKSAWEPGKGNIPPAMAWDAVSQIARRYISDCESMPEPLRSWVFWRLIGRNRPPKGQYAGPWKRGRDLMMQFAISDVCERFGLDPTRNDEPAGRSCCPEGGSACDVVGAAVGVGFKNAVRIWGEQDPEEF